MVAATGLASCAGAIDVLCRYDWPGSVRELENVIVRTLVSSGGRRIVADQLPHSCWRMP